MRPVDLCPHRRPDRAGAGYSCGLVATLLETEAPGLAAVGEDACRACCAGPIPDRGHLGPVVASLVARAADGVEAAGGGAGCSPARAGDLKRWALGHLLHVEAEASGSVATRPAVVRPGRPTVAVVIPCHNHAPFLGEAIRSVLAQTAPVAEVLVIDDASTDATAEVARRYESGGVRYLRVEFRSVYQVRRAGLAATTAEILCFLDADDILPPDYVAQGLPLFERREVGVAYAGLDHFGARQGHWTPPDFDRGLLEFRNYMIAASMVRRRALEVADAFAEPDARETLEDWHVWRRVIAAGWVGARHPGTVRYRRHEAGYPSLSAQGLTRPYFENAGLQSADVTIATPLAGRGAFWPDYRDWLAAQTWPRARSQVLLVDSSGDPAFGREVRRFLAEGDYPATRYLALAVAEPGLADRPRARNAVAVNLACARIYNRIAREVTTPFVLIVEDDILPPVGVIDRLLRALDERTAAVAAPYRSRHDYQDQVYVAWDDHHRHYRGGVGVQRIGGCGFGCLLIRRAVLAHEVFSFGFGEIDWYDLAFCRRLRQAGWTIKLDWSQECLHRGLP